MLRTRNPYFSLGEHNMPKLAPSNSLDGAIHNAKLCFSVEVTSDDNFALSTRRQSEFDSPRGRVLSSRSAEIEGYPVRAKPRLKS
jgi:hypothetical protein